MISLALVFILALGAEVAAGETFWIAVNSGCESDDFKFGGHIDSGEKLVDTKHRRVL